METTVIERIKIIANKKEITYRQFAIQLDFNYGTLNNYIIGKNKSINIELICKIVAEFPDISAEWILIGEGNMFKETSTEKPNDSTNEMMLKTIIELSGENAILKEKIKEIEKERSYKMAAEPVKKYTKH